MARSIRFYRTPGSPGKAEVLGAEMLDAYNEIVNHYHSSKAKETLGRFQIIDKELAGFNPFMCVNLQKVLPENKGLITRKDLETALSFNPEFFLDDYIDFGVALKSNRDPNYKQNDLIARTLAEQLKSRGISLDRGKLIPFSVLDPPENEDSFYGLVFGLVDLSSNEIKERVMDLDAFKWNYRRKKGISCAYLGEGFVWCYSDEDLSFFDSDTRVVVVSAEGASLKK